MRLVAGQWGAFAEVDEGAVGAGADALIAVFEAVEHLQRGTGGDGSLEAAGGDGLHVGAAVLLHFEIHDFGLHEPGAGEAPSGGDDLFDEREFDGVAGLVALDELMVEFLESYRAFILEDERPGEVAVFGGVL